MIPELGHFALVCALVLAGAQFILPMLGAARGNVALMNVARPAAYVQCLLVVVAFVTLACSFAANDFSVLYVANNSNSSLPLIYRFCAVWGGHEGSLLLWSMVLTFWCVAVARGSRALPLPFVARVVAVLGAVNVGFLSFILFTSDPFDRHFPPPPDGQDLNPLLQDPGLIVHPPLLYMGYVGFSVAFAFAVAALIEGRLDSAWARWTRPWTIAAWLFLSIGITLGSWWAYYELGWGGWWFWDPVENASFMPWLVGTALIHSLAVTEKRDAFKSWTALLAICAFSLSLLGTFLVRSGVLTSVHAFANDPTRGTYILMLLGVAVGGSLLLYAWRGGSLRDRGSFALASREGMLLANNVILLVAAAAVLIGTLYPLALDALGLGKISVGHPYFDAVFVPLMLVLGALLGPGSRARWKRHPLRELFRGAWPVFALCAVLAAAAAVATDHGHLVAGGAGLTVAFWVIANTVLAWRERLAHRASVGSALRVLSRGFLGMTLAHLGFATAVIGVTLVTTGGEERDVRLAVGEATTLGPWEFRLTELRNLRGPNFDAVEGVVRVSHSGEPFAELLPQKRVYDVQGSAMTEAGIDAGILRDVMASLGEPRGADAWTLRLQVKPFIRWIWCGGLLMALGGFIAATDRRYRSVPARAGARERLPALGAEA